MESFQNPQNSWAWEEEGLKIMHFYIPYSKEGQIEQVAWGCGQFRFWPSQGWRIHNVSMQPAPGSITLTVKKVFLMFKWNFALQFVPPCSLVLSLDTTEKSLDPSSILPPHQVFICIWKIPLSLLFYRLGSPSSHLCLFDGCTKAWTTLVVLDWTLSMSVSHRGVRTRLLQMGLSRGEGSSPSTWCWAGHCHLQHKGHTTGSGSTCLG